MRRCLRVPPPARMRRRTAGRRQGRYLGMGAEAVRPSTAKSRGAERSGARSRSSSTDQIVSAAREQEPLGATPSPRSRLRQGGGRSFDLPRYRLSRYSARRCRAMLNTHAACTPTPSFHDLILPVALRPSPKRGARLESSTRCRRTESRSHTNVATRAAFRRPASRCSP